MMKYVIKLNNFYYGDSYLHRRILFSPEFEDATFFKTIEECEKIIVERGLPEYCKIIQVTYVEHDIGYVEHSPLVK